MTKFVPINKQSKKAQKAANRLRRASWGPLNPTTRVPRNPRAYNRNKLKKMPME